LSVSRDALHDSFGLSLVAFGYLSSAFSWTYALMQMPAGVLAGPAGEFAALANQCVPVERFLFRSCPCSGPQLVLRGTLASGRERISHVSGECQGLGLLVYAREERSLATAITDAAAKFSSAIGVPLIGLLLVYFGWRWSFAATGFISFLYFVLFYLIYRNPSEDKGLSANELAIHSQRRSSTGRSGKAAKRQLRSAIFLKQRKVYGLALGWGAYNYTFFLLLTWLPSYLSVSLHVDLLHSVFYTSVPWLFATFTDLLVGGWLVDSLIQRGWMQTGFAKP
jgi:MFS transporter, ACS family, D-galactonate transporter